MPALAIKLPSGEYDPIEFDSILEESPELTADVTENPMGASAPTADHVQPKPASVSLLCGVTNTPIQPPRSHAEEVTQIDGAGARFDRVASVFRALRDALRTGTEVRVALRAFDIPRGMLTSVSTTHDVENATSALIRVTVREILTASSETVAVPQIRMAQRTRPVRNVAPIPIEPTPEEEALGQSIIGYSQ